jgi:hypothetical protein
MGKMSNPILLIIACLTVAEACFSAETVSAQGMRPYPEDRMILAWMRQDRHGTAETVDTDDPSSRRPNLDVSDCFTGKSGNAVEKAMVEKALGGLKGRPEATGFESRLAALLKTNATGGDPRWKSIYLDICRVRRTARLRRVAEFCGDYVFAKHCQLQNQPSFASSAFLSDSPYKDRLGDWRMGAGLYRLRVSPEGEITIQPLLERPKGIIRDPSVSLNGRTLAFSMRESEADDYHLYTMDLAIGTVKQITFGAGTADVEPCWLPGGDLLFTSSRCDVCVPCWSSDVMNIYRCRADGKFLRRLTFDHAHDVKPSLLNDGRIIYTRWEYNDRNSAPVHKLFQMNDDGTAQAEFYGNNSFTPFSLFHAVAIPGSSVALAIAGGHHVDQSGRLVLIDRSKGTQEEEGLEYAAPRNAVVPAMVDFYAKKGELFQYPCAIDKDNYLVSYVPEGGPARSRYKIPFGIYWMDNGGARELLAFDPAIHCGQIVPIKTRSRFPQRAPNFDLRKSSGVFYVQDVYFGPGLVGVTRGTIKAMRIVALDHRAMSAGVAYPQPTAQVHTPVSVGTGSWDVKHALGTVDVEADGSCCFEAPPRCGVYLQLLDGRGRMVQTMRSWTTVQPGERFGCLGCHEKKSAVSPPEVSATLALKRPPQKIRPLYARGEIEEPEFLASLTPAERTAMDYLNTTAPQRMDAPQGFSYLRDVQPVWDRHCVQCHAGKSHVRDSAVPLNLLGDTGVYDYETSFKGLPLVKRSPTSPYVNYGKDTTAGRNFAISYLELTNYGKHLPYSFLPYNSANSPSSKQFLLDYNALQDVGGSRERSRYVEYLPVGFSYPPMISPDSWGARHSMLMEYLEPAHYGVQVSQHEKDLVATWIDLNVPYCGSYMEANRWDAIVQPRQYLHRYNDLLRPAYLFQEAKRLRHAVIECADLEAWKKGDDTYTTPDVLGGMDRQQTFVDAYTNLVNCVPIVGLAAGRNTRGGTNASGNETRDLAENPTATIFSLTSFPWATANSHWRYERRFAPTCVLNGNGWWRPNRRTDLWLKVDLGRQAALDEVVITLHLNEGQAKTWKSATLKFSDGSSLPISLTCTAKPQVFPCPGRKASWVMVTDLKEDFPFSDNGIARVSLNGRDLY